MPLKFKVFPLENSPGFVVHQLDLHMKLTLQKAFQAEGVNITAEQWGILNCLWEEEGIHQSAIAERIGKDRHTITRMLNILDSNGFIRRAPTQEDKRRLHVYLTDSGRDVKGKLVPIALGCLERAFAGLTPEEAAELIRIMKHITGNLKSLKA
ncbi:MAG: MarR family transcriptional regulator [Deltaproteobacteria bacterium]|nr:MarR family transcriptional regulator [Deltaproteobacteria bacterium]